MVRLQYITNESTGHTTILQTAYHYLRDVLGSIAALTASNGNVVERYTYDPYGKTYVEMIDGNGVATATNASSYGNPFAWTSQRYDAATGTYHFWARTYSPVLGRWLQRDPIDYNGGSVNLYDYLLDNPILQVDPFGLEPNSEVAGYIGSVLGPALLAIATAKAAHDSGALQQGINELGKGLKDVGELVQGLNNLPQKTIIKIIEANRALAEAKALKEIFDAADKTVSKHMREAAKALGIATKECMKSKRCICAAIGIAARQAKRQIDNFGKLDKPPSPETCSRWNKVLQELIDRFNDLCKDKGIPPDFSPFPQ
jgi:RHS repeat-associated protein